MFFVGLLLFIYFTNGIFDALLIPIGATMDLMGRQHLLLLLTD